MFLILISKQPGAAKNRSIILEIVSGFVDREGTSTFERNAAIGIADMTPTMSQGVPVSLPLSRMWTTFPDRAPEVLVSVLRALNYETAWLSQASLVQETSGSSRWSLEMSLGIGEEEGDAILSSLIPDCSETPGREVEIQEVVGGEEEEEL